MKVQLALTCMCDAFFGDVGCATVKVLEAFGCEVQFPDGQTCCGQPPFNSGDWITARALAERTQSVFDPRIPIVVPSASCAAMMRHGYERLNIERKHRVYELSEFMLDELRVKSLHNARRVQRRVAFHQSCHGRMINLGDRQLRLLRMIPGLEIVEPMRPEQCCGFGGAFSATHPTVSAGIGGDKLNWIRETRSSVVVGGDMGCLMSLKTLAESLGTPIVTMHYAQLLAEALS